MATLTTLDITGLQNFVFGSQRLVDIVAASAVVSEVVSGEGLAEYLRDGGEVIFADGGNALVSHPTRDHAESFVAAFSEFLLRSHPPLGLSVCHFEGEPTSDEVATSQARKKLARPFVPAEVGFGFTALCVESGRPAGDLAPQGTATRPTAADIIDRRARRPRPPPDAAVQKARLALGQPDAVVDYASMIDDLQVGPKSEIAVVHLDGTGIGRSIRAVVRDLGPDGRYMMSCISEEIGELFGKLIEEAVIGTAQHAVKLKPPQSRYVLPVRPILQGGDDVTFVCRATLALPLVRVLFARLQAAKLELLGLEGVPAGAGVAIGPVGAPLWALIDTAYQLTSSAKAKAAIAEQGWAYDWHVGLPGDDVELLRKRRSGASGAVFTSRPYVYGAADEQQMLQLLSSESAGAEGGIRNPWWRNHRTLLRRLVDILQRGDDPLTMETARRAFARATEIADADTAGAAPAWRGFGWRTSGTSVLHDAFELIDRWEDL